MQRSQPAWREEWRSSHANGETHRWPERSPWGSTSVSTKRNEATSRQPAPTSRQTGENLRAVRTQQTGENPRAVRMQQTDENLSTVGTQQTGVDPRTEIALSHMPTSIETRGRIDNARTRDDQARSVSRNVLRHLGMRVVMRDSLHKRRELECSQYLTT